MAVCSSLAGGVAGCLANALTSEQKHKRRAAVWFSSSSVFGFIQKNCGKALDASQALREAQKRLSDCSLYLSALTLLRA